MPESFAQRSFQFALDILSYYRLIRRTTDLPQHIALEMLRAGTSIGANLEEAVSASSRRDLLAKNSIALREARECRYWLRIVRADQPALAGTDQLLSECHQLVSVLSSAVHTLRIIPKRP